MLTETLPPALAGVLRFPTEDSIWVLRGLLPTYAPVYAVWEQEDPWGVSGLLEVVVAQRGAWFALTAEAYAYLRGQVSVAPADWLADTPSQYQPAAVEVVDGGNAAVAVTLGGLS